MWFCHRAGRCSSNLPLIANWYPGEPTVTISSHDAFRCVRLSKGRKNDVMWCFKSCLKLSNLLHRKVKNGYPNVSFSTWCIILWHSKGTWKEICVATVALEGNSNGNRPVRENILWNTYGKPSGRPRGFSWSEFGRNLEKLVRLQNAIELVHFQSFPMQLNNCGKVLCRSIAKFSRRAMVLLTKESGPGLYNCL